MSFSFQRFSFDSGRVSSIRTTSPTCAWLVLVVRVKLFVARDDAPIERMRFLARHLHHNRLLHAVGDHFAHHFLAAALHLGRAGVDVLVVEVSAMIVSPLLLLAYFF